MSSVIVVGAGGHAKVVVATAMAAGSKIDAIVDDDRATWGKQMLGHTISGPIADQLADERVTCVIAIGNNALRRRLGTSARCRFAVIVHPSAVVHESVQLGPGSVVFAGAVIQPDTRIGAHAIVNTAASIDHDCVLGEAVHVAPGARLAGGVELGDEVFVGIGAAIIPSIRIGAQTVVGAGAAVVRDLPAAIVAAGVPARRR